MNSRMPSLRRPGQVAPPPPSTNEESNEKRKSLLPTRNVGVGSGIAQSGLPTPSPTKATSKARNDRSAMPPPPAPLGRTQSVRTRNLPQPSPSGIAAPPPTGLQRSMTTRAPVVSKVPAQRVNPHSRTNSVDTGGPALKRSATTTTSMPTRLLRSQSAVTDTKTRPSVPTTPTTTDPVKPQVSRLGRPASTYAVPHLGQKRPAFSTLQQHYSPAKSVLPKPPVPSSRAAPSLQEKTIVSGAAFETTKLQSELLYLSLLHESAEANRLSYQKSAQKALKKDFDSAQHDIQRVRDEERLIQEQVNLSALAEWLGLSKDTGAHLSQDAAGAIQCLSGCLSELSTLSAPESKYSSLVQEFSDWVAVVNGNSSTAQLMVGPLPQEWHHLHASITQRLRLMERDIEMLPPPPEMDEDDSTESSLAIVLRCLRSLVTGMKQELDDMARLEKQVVSTEKQRVGNAVAGLSLDTLLQASEEWSPAW